MTALVRIVPNRLKPVLGRKTLEVGLFKGAFAKSRGSTPASSVFLEEGMIL